MRLTSLLISRLGSACRIGGRAAGYGGLALAVLLPCMPAQAQYYGWGAGPNYEESDYPGPGPRDYYPGPGPRGGYGGPGGYRDEPSSPPATLSLADIRQRIEQRGLRLIATPRRKGRIYLAAAEDARGVRHRLVFDAYEGRLIENTVIGSKGSPAEKPAPNSEAGRSRQ
jgi:hypothetical protein